MDDARAAWAAAQVHARVSDFVLQELVQLPAQLLHQLSHLGKTHKFTLTCVLFFIFMGFLQLKTPIWTPDAKRQQIGSIRRPGR